MMWLRIGAVAGAFVAAAAIMAPLRWAWAMAGARTDLSVDAVDGTIWNGRVEGVAWRRYPLGDFDVALSPFNGAFPTLLLSNGTGLLKSGRISVSASTVSLDAGEIQTSLTSRGIGEAGGLPLRISDAAITLTDGVCQSASGRIQVAAVPDLGSPAFNGELACLQGRLAYRSASPSPALEIPFAAAGIPRITAPSK